ncbi:MAG: hypothetical protein ACE5FF_11235 [Saprospiraceae bacterium]
MKRVLFTSAFFLAFLFGVSQTAIAASAVSLTKKGETETMTRQDVKSSAFVPGENLTKRQERRLKRGERRLNKLEKKLNKRGKSLKALGIDLSDPVDKWMWYWIFGWGAALVLYIIASAIATGSVYSGGFGIAVLFAYLGWIAGLFGTVALVIWLLKKFGDM